MKIVEITASSGRTVPHPRIDYASIRVDLSARATIGEDDDADAAVERLQAWLDQRVKSHVTKAARSES